MKLKIIKIPTRPSWVIKMPDFSIKPDGHLWVENGIFGGPELTEGHVTISEWAIAEANRRLSIK